MFQEDDGKDVEMQGLLGDYHMNKQSFMKMTEQEQFYLFVSVAYVFLLHPNCTEFDWNSLILPCVDNMRDIIYQAFHGKVTNVFRDIYTTSKYGLYVKNMQSFHSTKVVEGTELYDLLYCNEDDVCEDDGNIEK